jgi:hypothetical protein
MLRKRTKIMALIAFYVLYIFAVLAIATAHPYHGNYTGNSRGAFISGPIDDAHFAVGWDAKGQEWGIGW